MRSAAALRSAIEDGERILVPSLVLYEWLRGPRLPDEVAAQKARGREMDIAIAACAITHEAAFWTLNQAGFKDIPDLRYYSVR